MSTDPEGLERFRGVRRATPSKLAGQCRMGWLGVQRYWPNLGWLAVAGDASTPKLSNSSLSVFNDLQLLQLRLAPLAVSRSELLVRILHQSRLGGT